MCQRRKQQRNGASSLFTGWCLLTLLSCWRSVVALWRRRRI